MPEVVIHAPTPTGNLYSGKPPVLCVIVFSHWIVVADNQQQLTILCSPSPWSSFPFNNF